MPVVNNRVNAMARRILSGQQTGAGGGAIWRARVGLSEDNALLGKLIQMRGVDEGISTKAGVGPPHFVREDEDEVGFRGCHGLRDGGEEEKLSNLMTLRRPCFSSRSSLL